MSRVYETQDYLRIELTYTADVGGSIASAVIKYRDPDGLEGQWIATNNEADKYIYYELPAGSPLGVVGTWEVWSVATMDDTRVLPGSIFRFKVFEEGAQGTV